MRPAPLIFFVLGLLLGLAGIGAAIAVWVGADRLRPQVEEYVKHSQVTVSDVDQLYSDSAALLNTARVLLKDTPTLIANASKLMRTADKLGQTSATLMHSVAKDMRSMSQSLAKLLAPDLDLKKTAGQIDSVATEMTQVLEESMAFLKKMEGTAAEAGRMGESLEGLGNALPAPDEAPTKEMAEILKGDGILRAFDLGRSALAGLLLVLGLSSLVGAFANLFAARAPRSA